MQTSHRRERRPILSVWTAGITAFLVLNTSAAEARSERTYTVKRGDTLSHIAWQHLKSARKWTGLYQRNLGVVGKNPHLIYPGQVLVLSEVEASASRALAVAKKDTGSAASGQAPVKPAEGVKAAPVDPLLGDPAVSSTEPPVAALPGAPDIVPLPDTPGVAPPTQPLDMRLSAPPAFEPAPNPWLAAGASTLFPGAGQALLGDWARGGIYAGAAALLYGSALYGLSSNDSTLARTSSYALLGLSLVSPLDAFLMAASRADAEAEDPRKEARK